MISCWKKKETDTNTVEKVNKLILQRNIRIMVKKVKQNCKTHGKRTSVHTVEVSITTIGFNAFVKSFTREPVLLENVLYSSNSRARFLSLLYSLLFKTVFKVVIDFTA